MKNFKFGILFFSLLISGCAGHTVIKQATSTDNGALSACVYFIHTDWPKFFAHSATEIIWNQVDKQGHLDRDHPIISQTGRDGYLYTVNVPPGVYSPIFSAYSLVGLRFYSRFQPELIQEMQVKVKEGQFLFAGKLFINTGTEDGGTIMSHMGLRLRRLLPPFKSSAVTPPVDYNHLDRGSLSEAQSLRIARSIYEGTLWIDPIEKRLSEIGSPSPPIMKGPFWKKTQKEAINVSSFSYIDTLHWGHPIRIEGGAEWRQPKDKARIAVQFFEPGMKGYVKEGIYLERMREAGNSDDSHSLFSVHISTYFGQGVRYTSNVYPRQDLPGATSQVFITEAWLIKKGVGYYLIHYRSRRRNFQKFYPDFKKFTGYLAFEPKVKKEETYP